MEISGVYEGEVVARGALMQYKPKYKPEGLTEDLYALT